MARTGDDRIKPSQTADGHGAAGRRPKAAKPLPAKVPNASEVRLKTLKRRAELLGVVYESVSEHGIDGVSMRQIAAAANISTGTINYHFSSKRNLVIAALEAAYELPEDWEQYRGSPVAQLRRLVLGYVFRSSRDRFWRFWINYLAQSTRDEEMRRHQEERFRRQGRFWAHLLRDAIAVGEVRPDLDAAKVAERLLLVAHGLVVQQLQAPTPASRDHAGTMLNELFDEMAPPVAPES